MLFSVVYLTIWPDFQRKLVRPIGNDIISGSSGLPGLDTDGVERERLREGERI